MWATHHYSIALDYPVVDGLKFDASDEYGRPWNVKGSMVNGVPTDVQFLGGPARDARGR
ncbi:hypothetical protein ACOZ35_05840 [Halorubrum xinjiangense]|uniref:hypothetical protein n=1 Tax=Halorubrum xinjiangense TaxID=261291 RepID=UPI003C6FE21D